MNTKYMYICFSVIALTGASRCIGLTQQQRQEAQQQQQEAQQKALQKALQKARQEGNLMKTAVAMYENQKLLTAAGSDDLKGVVAALNASANVDAKNAQGQTALMIAAAKQGSYQIVEALITAKADVNASDPKGNTPLKLAIQNSCATSAVDLLNKSASTCNLSASEKQTLQKWLGKKPMPPETCNPTVMHKPRIPISISTQGRMKVVAE